MGITAQLLSHAAPLLQKTSKLSLFFSFFQLWCKAESQRCFIRRKERDNNHYHNNSTFILLSAFLQTLFLQQKTRAAYSFFLNKQKFESMFEQVRGGKKTKLGPQTLYDYPHAPVCVQSSGASGPVVSISGPSASERERGTTCISPRTTPTQSAGAGEERVQDNAASSGGVSPWYTARTTSKCPQ